MLSKGTIVVNNKGLIRTIMMIVFMRLWEEGRKITHIIEALTIYKYRALIRDSIVDLFIFLVQSIQHTLRIILGNFGALSNVPMHLKRLFPHDPPSIVIVGCCGIDLITDLAKNKVILIVHRIPLLSWIFRIS